MLNIHSRVYSAFRRPGLILAAMICAFSMPPAIAQVHSQTPSVLVIAGGGGLLSMFYDCVRHYQQQGLKMAHAIGQCMAIGVTRQSVAGRSGLSAEFAGGGSEPGVAGIQCDTLSVDPRVAQIVHRPADPGDSSRDPGLPMLGRPGTFDNHYSAFAQLLGLLSTVAAQEAVAFREQAKMTSDPVQKQILLDKANAAEELSQALFDAHDEIMSWYLARLAEYEKEKTPPSPPGDYPLPDPDAPSFANVTPDHVSACQNLTQFVNECSLAGWKTAPCQMFLDRLDGCGDPTITDPSPDEERECRSRRVSDEQARQVAFIVCSVDTTPGPDSDPCSGNLAQAMLYDFTYGGKNNPNAPICSNPFAYTTGESCTATFSVIVGPQEGAADVIEEARRRLGGPVFVIPAPSPIDPKSGGGCTGDPRCTP